MAVIHYHLSRRDNEGFQIAPTLIIFLVILGAGCILCCGFAILRLHSGDIETDSAWKARSPEQDAYMREVRERNLRKMPGAVPLMRDGMYHNSESSKMYLAHAPVSPSGGSTSAWG